MLFVFFSFSQQDFNMMMMMMMIKRLIIDENKMKNKNEKKLNSEFNRTNWKKKEKISLNHWLTHWSNNEKHGTYFFRFFMFDFFLFWLASSLRNRNQIGQFISIVFDLQFRLDRRLPNVGKMKTRPVFIRNQEQEYNS